jgi:hypothetical protein
MHSDIGPEFLMTRARLFAQRFAATGSLLLLAFMVIRFLWFPDGYFQIFGIAKLFLVLVAVNLVVGPGLSTLSTLLLLTPQNRPPASDIEQAHQRRSNVG